MVCPPTVAAEVVAGGFARARLPGRLDRRGRWLFDVAHNPAGLAVLLVLAFMSFSGAQFG